MVSPMQPTSTEPASPPIPSAAAGPARLGDAGAGTALASSASPPSRRRWGWRYIITRRALQRLGVLFLLLILGSAGLVWYAAGMPGSSFRGPLPPASAAQTARAARLRTCVEKLAGEFGGRSTFGPRKLAAAGAYLKGELLALGYAEVNETFVERGARCPNLEVILPGSDPSLPCIVVGAHYDAYQGTFGADDNASGTAAVLEIARALRTSGAAPLQRAVRLALFVNEEPPSFQTADMGSWVYAKDLRRRAVLVRGMLSLETIGYYRTEEGSQKYPLAPLAWVYPTRGDFIAFVGNPSSRWLVRATIRAFRASAQFPSEGAALPGDIAGVGWSDHWAFWQEGWDAIMVTDTAPFRNPNYHLPSDKADTLDYDRMSRVVEGITAAVRALANE
ncbi:hypothetical protein BH11PLA1_BH11PLA1_16060 [soil metagenome]